MAEVQSGDWLQTTCGDTPATGIGECKDVGRWVAKWVQENTPNTQILVADNREGNMALGFIPPLAGAALQSLQRHLHSNHNCQTTIVGPDSLVLNDSRAVAAPSSKAG